MARTGNDRRRTAGLGAAVVAAAVGLLGPVANATDGNADLSAADPPAVDTSGQTTAVVIEAVRSTNVGRGDAPGTLRLEVRNRSATPAETVDVRFELPPGTRLVDSGSTAGCRAPDTQVICDLGTVAPGATVPVAIALTTTDPSAPLGSTRRGVLLAPRTSAVDVGAGEIAEDGPDGRRGLDELPRDVTTAATATWRWSTEIRPLAATARVCATGLRGTATLTLGDGSSTTVTSDGAAVALSGPIATPPGANLPIELRASGTGWTTIGLVGGDETCDAAARGALGVNGRLRYRLPVDLRVGSQSTARITGAVWGTRAGRPITSVRLVNLGPDPAALDVTTGPASWRTTDCAPDPDGAVGSCRVPMLRSGSSATVTVERTGGAMAPWTARVVGAATPVTVRLPAG